MTRKTLTSLVVVAPVSALVGGLALAAGVPVWGAAALVVAFWVVR
jgi:hypothetical protein